MENKMKMKPMGDQLLLKADEIQKTTKSGIILTSTNDVYGYATVVDAGPGLFTQTGDRIPMTVKKGDTVLAPVNKLSGKNGNQIKLEEETYVLVRESEIAMVSDNS
tara:strand:- start:57 stop:374 length:318 start_codon:yes stop_codon:yes gene_type:complete